MPERGLAVPFQGEPGVTAVGDPVELAQRGPQVQAGVGVRPCSRMPSITRTVSASRPIPALKVK